MCRVVPCESDGLISEGSRDSRVQTHSAHMDFNP